MTGLDAANVLAGGAKIDTNGVETTIAQALLTERGGGGLTKEGNGLLNLTGANTYTGATTINGGKSTSTRPTRHHRYHRQCRCPVAGDHRCHASLIS